MSTLLNERNDTVPVLQRIDRDLGTLTGQAEAEFLPVGALLNESAAAIMGIGGSLNELGRTLQGEGAFCAVSELNGAVEQIHRLHIATGSTDALPVLAADSTDIAKHLETLRRVVSEITALAINGKIQAALVATAGVDFTVFTAEIGRLGIMAAQQIEQAAGRLTTVRGAIANAIEAETTFVRNEAGELQNIRTRVESNIALMVERGRRAAHALDAVQEKSRQVADRVANTVAELQINDITCQRIEHVRLVLRGLATRGADWLRGLDDQRFNRLIVATCRLQSQQLEQAAQDYLSEIEALANNLRGLSNDAGDLLNEAESAFGDSRGGIFLTEIESDITRATALLDAYSNADSRTRAMVSDVSQGFVDMSEDLAAIRSIDADMRVMGLNATLKCGRLGNAGQALGVVAQELRACSRRTEDSSKMVSDLLKKVLDEAENLSRRSGAALLGEELNGSHCGGIMAQCVSSLNQMSTTMTQTLENLRHDAPAVAGRLADGAGRISFHHRLQSDCAAAATEIARLAESLDDGVAFDNQDYDSVRKLTESNYTMDSERLIHQRFDGRGSIAAAPVHQEASLDDLFF